MSSDGYQVNRKTRDAFMLMYNDAFDSELLTKNELLVFLAILRYSSWDANKISYPKMSLLAKKARLSERSVQRALQTMAEKNIVIVKSRFDGKRQTSNLYILNDDPSSWIDPSKKSEKKALASAFNGRQTIEEEANTSGNSLYLHPKNTTCDQACQDSSKYWDLDWIKDYFDYQAIVDNSSEADADMLMDVIHDTLNSKESIMTVNHSSVSKTQVVDNIMNLTLDDLEFCLVKFKGAKSHVKNVKAYLRSMLYNAKTQQTAEFHNQIM